MKTLMPPWRMEHFACRPPSGQGCLFERGGVKHRDHLHFLNVPRWQGDHNFITVLGELKTIPEHFLHNFDRLLPTFRDLAL